MDSDAETRIRRLGSGPAASRTTNGPRRAERAAGGPPPAGRALPLPTPARGPALAAPPPGTVCGRALTPRSAGGPLPSAPRAAPGRPAAPGPPSESIPAGPHPSRVHPVRRVASCPRGAMIRVMIRPTPGLFRAGRGRAGTQARDGARRALTRMPLPSRFRVDAEENPSPAHHLPAAAAITVRGQCRCSPPPRLAKQPTVGRRPPAAGASGRAAGRSPRDGRGENCGRSRRPGSTRIDSDRNRRAACCGVRGLRANYPSHWRRCGENGRRRIFNAPCGRYRPTVTP